jgi:thiamine biosynthesis lipoprotein
MPSAKSNSKPTPESAGLPQPQVVWQFEAIGTHWWIGIYQPLATDKVRRLQAQVEERIEAFDRAYSRFRDDSLISRMAAHAGDYVLPDDSRQLMALYRRLYDATQGAVTPLIGQPLSDAGYDAAYSLRAGVVTRPPAWDDVMGYDAKSCTLHLKRPALLDFGAAGKGYLVDIVFSLLRKAGVDELCVDAGGDMRCNLSTAPLRVGLEHPDDASQIVGVAALRRGAMCGSAGNRRAWGVYHHIMDPFTLQSPRHIMALWTTAGSALVADGLATALFFASPARLKRYFAFSYLIVYADGQAERSAEFPAQLFTT